MRSKCHLNEEKNQIIKTNESNKLLKKKTKYSLPYRTNRDRVLLDPFVAM